MKDEIGYYNVNKHLINSKPDLDEKNIYLPYDIQLLSILKDVAIITDANFIISYWNPAAEELYGWKASEVVGKDAKKVLRTDFIDAERPETGIEPEYRDRIFQIFKLPHGIGKYEGTGIGRAISKIMVEIYGGKSWGRF